MRRGALTVAAFALASHAWLPLLAQAPPPPAPARPPALAPVSLGPAPSAPPAVPAPAPPAPSAPPAAPPAPAPASTPASPAPAAPAAPDAAPASTEKSTLGRLRVRSEAPGQVIIDGEERGAAPVDVEVPDGEHLITVQFDGGGESSVFAKTIAGRETEVDLAPSEHRQRFDEGESGLRFSVGLAPELAFVEVGNGGFLGVGGRLELWLRSALAPSVDIGGGLLGGIVVYPEPATGEVQPSEPPFQPVIGLAFEARIHSLEALSSGLGLQLDIAPDPLGLRLRDSAGEQSATALGIGPRLVPIALRFGGTRQIELTVTFSGGPYVLLLDGEGGFRTSASLGGHYVF